MTVAANLPKPTDRTVGQSIDPAVLHGIRQASQATHVDFGYLMAQAAQESGFNSDAKASSSSATGLFQFIDSTWLDMVRQHGAQHGLGDLAQQITTDASGRPAVADPAEREKILALRTDPTVSAALAAEFAKSNKAEVERAIGRPAHSADLYLAHFLGAGGASELLKAVQTDGATPAAQLLPEAAAANHAVFYDAQSGAPRTVSEIYRSFSDRVERNAATYASLGPVGASAPPATAASWLRPQPTLGGIGTPIASLFNAMLLTALKLLGGTTAVPPTSRTAVAAPGSARRHDDGTIVS
jgi:hypothetical protein